MPPPVARVIRNQARRYGIDPAAALAVARGEGGLRWGAVGDSGSSFGPFQLHRGGAMPRGRSAAWANSPAGVAYAMRKMAEAGARGQTGARAVETIIRNFERPADPDTSVRNALGRLGENPDPGFSRSGGNVSDTGFDLPDIAGGLGRQQGGGLDLPDFASNLGKGGIYHQPKKFKIPGLDLTPPPGLQGPVDVGTRAGDVRNIAPVGAVMPSNSVGARAVKSAATQLGDPYQFGATSVGRNPRSFDCSSLVQWAYAQQGVRIPRDTVGQQAALPLKSWKNLKPGDPIYRKSGGHVVIYAGNGRVIAAPHTGTNVQYQSLSNFPQSDWEVRSIN